MKHGNALKIKMILQSSFLSIHLSSIQLIFINIFLREFINFHLILFFTFCNIKFD